MLKRTYYPNLRHILAVFAVGLLIPTLTIAQGDIEACPIDDFENCCLENNERCFFDFPLFCQGKGDASFRIGVDFKSSPRVAVYTAFFTDRKVKGKLKAFFVDGRIVPGLGRQAKIGTLKCAITDEGSMCSIRLPREKLLEISEIFDTEQDVLNLALRKSQNEFCVGKFTNNTEKISTNDRVERSLCSLEATELSQTEGLSLEGDGFFDPAGYSTDGQSHFHLTLSGFPTKKKFHGCIATGENKKGETTYQSVLDFKSFSPEQTDVEIYRSLSEAAQAELDRDPLSYSYDVLRQFNSSSLELRLGGFGDKNLSQINKQVSAPSAKKERTDSNKKRKKDRRGRREKKKKKKQKRSTVNTRLAAAPSYTALPATTKKAGKQEVFSWLSFDPIGGNALFIAKNCNGDVSSKTLATVTCGASDSPLEGFACLDLTGDSGDGRFCKEIRTDYEVSVLRVKELAAGTYHICFDGNASGATVTTSGSIGDEFGEVKLTTSSALAEGDTFTLIEASLADVTAISLSTSDDCSSPLLQGSF